ncbi:flagellar protein FlaG [Pseudomonas sp.]|uniref:flagellar protein FlaG n=1 Tax=Pseudomonas sp. TaxID=306 RepID=UPI003BB506B9
MDIGSIQKPLIQVATRESARLAPDEALRTKASESGASAIGDELVVDKLKPGTAVEGESASREQLEEAVASIQDFVQSVRRSINFSVEETSGRVVVKVTDAGSGDVIRQIPSEEALQLAENLSEVRSLLFKAEA